MDARRRIWIPLSVDFAHDPFGSKILDKFGHAGLLTWVAFLAACKRNASLEGQFDFGSEAEGWALLGLDYPVTPDFTLDTFFTFTGQAKKTRRTRFGRVTQVICRDWGKWQVRKPTRSASSESPSKQEEITDKVLTRNEQDTDKVPRPTITSTNTITPTTKVREVFDYWVEARGRNPERTRLTEGRRKIIKARLSEFSIDEVKAAIDGIAKDPWEKRHEHDDLTKVFRPENFEKFLALADDPAAMSKEEREALWLQSLEEKGVA